MSKYRVYAITMASKYVGDVEADSKEDAENKAWNMEDAYFPSLCHQCASKMDFECEIYEMQVEEIE